MIEWKNGVLKDLAVFQRGHDLPKSEIKNGIIPVAGSNGVIGYHNTATTKGPGITIGRSGNIGTPHLYKNDFWAHNTVLYVNNFMGNDELYVFYFLRNIDFTGFNAGSAVPTLNRNHIHEIPINIPPLAEQRAIATVLSSLDDKIDLLYRQNKTLETIAETLFTQWFINGTDKGWEAGKLNDLVEIQSGFAFKSVTFTEIGPYRLVTIKAVQDGYLDLNNADGIAIVPSKMPIYCHLNEKDILLSLTGNVGRCCIVDKPNLLLNQRVAKIHPIFEKDRAFSYFYFRLSNTRRQLEEIAKGSAQAKRSPIETGNLPIMKPTRLILDRFSHIATPLFDKLFQNKNMISALESLRDTLLPKLMSGEVRVEV